jgi:hypothetical protein
MAMRIDSGFDLLSQGNRRADAVGQAVTALLGNVMARRESERQRQYETSATKTAWERTNQATETAWKRANQFILPGGQRTTWKGMEQYNYANEPINPELLPTDEHFTGLINELGGRGNVTGLEYERYVAPEIGRVHDINLKKTQPEPTKEDIARRKMLDYQLQTMIDEKTRLDQIVPENVVSILDKMLAETGEEKPRWEKEYNKWASTMGYPEREIESLFPKGMTRRQMNTMFDGPLGALLQSRLNVNLTKQLMESGFWYDDEISEPGKFFVGE